jgi:lysophospholipid acyltransferase (LPLAT)-like uncharacterized protein
MTPADALPRPAIFACWHEQALAAVPCVARLAAGGRPMAVMASLSRDGELTARVATALGWTVVRGSTSRGGRAGLLALYRGMTRLGLSPVVLPDGPRGPRREPKPGVVVLAQMAAAPIVPFACVPRRSVVLGSWDRMLLPLPLTSIRLALGEPLLVPRELSAAERERRLALLRERLDSLTSGLAEDPPAAASSAAHPRRKSMTARGDQKP